MLFCISSEETKIYNPMSISDLKTLDPTFPWLEYINAILSKDVVQVTEEEIIIVEEPDYVTNMRKLISKTPKRVQANYLLWRMISSVIRFQQRCLEMVRDKFFRVIEPYYVTKNFDDESKEMLEEKFKSIRKEFGI